MTGCNFVYFSALELFSGTGELSVMAGTLAQKGKKINKK